MAKPAFDGDTVVADVADEAAGDAVARTAVDLDCAAAGRLEGQAAKGNVRNIGELQQGFGQQGEQSFRCGSLNLLFRGGGSIRTFCHAWRKTRRFPNRIWRPEVKQAGLAVEEPLAGLVQLLQEVKEAEPLPFPETILPKWSHGFDQVTVEIDGIHTLVGIGPIP